MWLLKLWRAQQRRIDMRILWPVLRQKGRSMETARAAFAAHCAIDPAWSDLSNKQIANIIDSLD
jgi:hypothetical protein